MRAMFGSLLAHLAMLAGAFTIWMATQQIGWDPLWSSVGILLVFPGLAFLDAKTVARFPRILESFAHKTDVLVAVAIGVAIAQWQLLPLATGLAALVVRPVSLRLLLRAASSADHDR